MEFRSNLKKYSSNIVALIIWKIVILYLQDLLEK